MNSKFLSLLFSTTLAGVVLVSLVDAAAKSFVLLCLAVVVCLGLRRASAATRHLIWLSTLGATLALPVLSLCLPQWRVLPEWLDVTRGSRGTEPFVAAFPPIPTLPGDSQTEPLPQSDLFPAADQFPPMDEATEQALKSLRESGVDPTEALNGAWAGLGMIRLLAVGIGAVLATTLLIVWGVGALVLLLPMVRSAWTLHRLAASMGIVTNDPVAAATGAIARELGVPTPRLYLGSAGAMPMVWGIRRGRLLLPAEATAWDAVRLRAVLLHELAHLRRHDPLTQAIAQVARALHWFNPLAWLAVRCLSVEQERACDDYVLRGGVKPSDYAGHVLELATQLQPAPRAASVALAMADRTRIEGRLHTILDAARDRRNVSRWLAALTVLIAGSAALSLAMLQAADGTNGDASAVTAREQPAKVADDAAPITAEQRDATPQGIRHFSTGASVGTIACSADGKLIAVANDGPTINMQVDGKRTIVDNWTPSVEILNAETGKTVVSLKLTTANEDVVLSQTERAPDFEVKALAFSPDGKVLAVGTTVGQVKLFNARTGELVQSLDDFQGKLADSKTSEKLKLLTRAMGSVASLAFSPDGSLLAMCGESFGDVLVPENARRLTNKLTGPGRIEVWEVKTGKLKHDLIGLAHAHAVAFSPDGNVLASAGRWADRDYGTGVILWNPQTGAKLHTITKETNGITRAVAFSPDSKLVAMSTLIHNKDSDADASATAISVAHVGTGTVEWQHTVPASARPVGFFSMSVWTLCGGESLRFFRPETGVLLGVIGLSADPPQGGRWNDFATAKRDGFLALGGVDNAGKGRVQIWDISSDAAPVKDGETDKQAEKRPVEKRDSLASPASTRPEDKYVQDLFKIWQAAARSDGKIPGGLIGQLQAKVEEFVRNNRNDASGAPYAKKVEPILPRFDASHDWSPDEALALLNDLAALSSIPIETTLWTDAERRVYPGQPLPADLKDAPWGEPTAEGLRAARPLDPRAESYPVGTALRSRILLHNDGKEPLLLRAKSWMQPGYAAHDALGNSLHVESTYWTTLGRVQTWRLAPGEFCEIATPGLGVGKDAGRDEWADVRVGSWIDVADGVDVTLSPGNIGTIDDSRASQPTNGRELKLEIIRERIEREFPLPASAADREKIVRRVTKDIFGGDPTPDEISAFVTDKSDEPFTALASRLLRRAGLAAFIGELKPGTITFRTTPADPDAANRPKVAIGPGRYTLDENVRLIIVGKPVAGRRTSDVEIRFWAADPKAEPPGKPYKIQVPDGFGTWAITCRPRTGILWVLTQGALRKIDYSNPAQVKETSITRGSRDDMPDEFREAVKRTLTISNVPAEQITALIAGSAPDTDPKQEYAKDFLQAIRFHQNKDEVKFRVVAADPTAKPGVGTATEPGRYSLAPGVRIQVTRIAHPDGRFTNEASILWLADDAKDAAPSHQYLIKLPDGLSTFAIAWERGGRLLWIADETFLRRIDFADRAKVTEDRFDPKGTSQFEGLTKPIHDELQNHLRPGATGRSQPASPANPQENQGEPGARGTRADLLRAAAVVVEAMRHTGYKGNGTRVGIAEPFTAGAIVAADGLIVTYFDPRDYGTMLHREYDDKESVPGSAGNSGSLTRVEDFTFQVTLVDGRRFEADLLVRDVASGLCLLKINATDLPVLGLADSSLRPGETLLVARAFGEPGARGQQVAPSVSLKVTGTDQGTHTDLPALLKLDRTLPASTTIGQPGTRLGPSRETSVGSPLVDSRGRLAGVVIARGGRISGDFECKFALPFTHIVRLVNARREGPPVCCLGTGDTNLRVPLVRSTTRQPRFDLETLRDGI